MHETTPTSHSPEGEPSQETLDLVLDLLSRIKTEELPVLDAIDEVLLEPYPNPNDEEAIREYSAKMLAVRIAAEVARGRSQLLIQLQDLAKESQIDNSSS